MRGGCSQGGSFRRLPRLAMCIDCVVNEGKEVVTFGDQEGFINARCAPPPPLPCHAGGSFGRGR